MVVDKREPKGSRFFIAALAMFTVVTLPAQ